jgi:hypothetical protein
MESKCSPQSSLEIDEKVLWLTDSQFLLTFDTNPIILNRVKETLRADPLVVRYVKVLLLKLQPRFACLTIQMDSIKEGYSNVSTA